jgi:Cu/Ag efflux protein CusF
MKKLVVLMLAAFLAVAGMAVAAEIEGKVQSVDQTGKEIVLDDGTKIVWDDSTNITAGKLEDLKEGAKVKASYEEKDGKNVASAMEVSE